MCLHAKKRIANTQRTNSETLVFCECVQLFSLRIEYIGFFTIIVISFLCALYIIFFSTSTITPIIY